VKIYAKNLPEQFLRLPEEESDLFGPYLDLMSPADGDRTAGPPSRSHAAESA